MSSNGKLMVEDMFALNKLQRVSPHLVSSLLS
jgi:hypothetical protein